MMNKSNTVMIGIICLIVGVLIFVQSFIDINYFPFLVLGIGIALLVAYFTKKNTLALIIGIYLTYFGGFQVLSTLGLGEVMPSTLAAAFFLVPGIAFLIIYLFQNKHGLLTFASLLIWTGIYILLSSFGIVFNSFLASVFIYLGFALVTIYLLSKGNSSKATLYCGIFLIVFGFILAVNFAFISFIFNNLALVLAILFMIIGVVVIVKAVKKI